MYTCRPINESSHTCPLSRPHAAVSCCLLREYGTGKVNSILTEDIVKDLIVWAALVRLAMLVCPVEGVYKAGLRVLQSTSAALVSMNVVANEQRTERTFSPRLV
jgi:hypothetical protein